MQDGRTVVRAENDGYKLATNLYFVTYFSLSDSEMHTQYCVGMQAFMTTDY